MCLVEVPAECDTITKTTATTRVVEVPAEYGTVQSTKLAEPAREERTKIPARYETITKTEMVSDGHLEWRSILCDTNMTRKKISSIQRALRTAGHNPGATDGVIGRSTVEAVNAFQRAKGLPVDQYLNMQTVRALGITN
jgi:peptidoglycan hydrolase-like protein with peptidoglycan-binding domain